MSVSRSQYKLSQVIKDLKDKDNKELRPKFAYRSKEPQKRDWFAYNEAQINEATDFLLLVRNMVDDVRKVLDYIDDRPRIAGQQPKSPFDLAKSILVQQYFQASNRVAAGFARMFKEKLGIEQDITYKDIERAYSNVDVQDIINELVKMTNEPIKDKETEFSIDGTGMETSIKQNYANDKGDDKKKATYRMLIGMVGYEFKMYSALCVNSPGSESPFLVPLLEQTAEIFERIDLVCADAMYYSHDNCTKVAEHGAKPRIYPRVDAVINAKGSIAKKTMLLELIDDTQSWLEDYHKRSISETVNSVHKVRFPRPFLKRREDRLRNEGFDKMCAYNMRMLAYNHYTKDLSVKWLTPS